VWYSAEVNAKVRHRDRATVRGESDRQERECAVVEPGDDCPPTDGHRIDQMLLARQHDVLSNPSIESRRFGLDDDASERVLFSELSLILSAAVCRNRPATFGDTSFKLSN
jgi:hypothetical protein